MLSVKPALFLTFLLLLLSSFSSHAVREIKLPKVAETSFLFIENLADDNYFVSPLGLLDPRMTGANRWTHIKDSTHQQSLGYVNDYFNQIVPANNNLDMWIDDSPINSPLTGLRCIYWYAGCNDSSLISPQATDKLGFYHATSTSGGLKWNHGMMSESFYQYLLQMPVGDKLVFKLNSCWTTADYDASVGERCKDQSRGSWYSRVVTHRKGAHLNIINNDSLIEVFISSDGVPTLGENSGDCFNLTLNGNTSIACKMVSYKLTTSSASNTSIHIFPAINNPALDKVLANDDIYFSLDKNNWKNMSGSSYYTFNDLKKSDSIYIFFTTNFFQKLIKQGLINSVTRDLFDFRFYNTVSAESGWYEFSSSTNMIIKPRNFSASIISDDHLEHVYKRGEVGHGQSAIDFGYYVSTSGKTAADEVLIKVSGPGRVINGRWYCIFSSSDNSFSVPFPAVMSYQLSNGNTTEYDVGCNDQWHNITDALWTSTPWNDPYGEVGTINKTHVNFKILMDDPISLRTTHNLFWWGEVNASGQINIKATWHNEP